MALRDATGKIVDLDENRRRMRDGELYYAIAPDLNVHRSRCTAACRRFNSSEEVSRRKQVELFLDIVGDKTPLPPESSNPDEEATQLQHYPFVTGPVRMDYGYNVKLGREVFVNFNSTWIDTCTITVGARTLIGPNCSFYSGTHPLDPFVRNGIRGPESGRPISIGEDCWFGGNVVVLPGVTIGRGVTVGAGSVVTKDVPDFVCVVGNPARILKRIDVSGSAPPAGGVEILAGEEVAKAS